MTDTATTSAILRSIANALDDTARLTHTAAQQLRNLADLPAGDLDPELTGNPDIDVDYDLTHSPDRARWTPDKANR